MINKSGRRMPALAGLALLLCLQPLSAQDASLDQLYSYPFSVDVAYRSLNDLSAAGGDFGAYGVEAAFRLPFGEAKRLRASATLGLESRTARASSGAERYDHKDLSLGLGLGMSRRMTKSFELGADILALGGESIYPELIPGGESYGSYFVGAAFGGSIALDPSYNLSIGIHPSAGYRRSLGSLSDFDGFTVGIGFSLSFRPGIDPDALLATMKSLKLLSAELNPVFASMQSYYAKKPFGRIRIKNAERYRLEELSLSFFQAGYMDSPTKVSAPLSLAPGEEAEIELRGVFNDEVFRVEGTTPLSGEIVCSYMVRGRNLEQRFPLSYELYDKNSIIWDDDEKLAAFITPSDSALRNYLAYIRKSCRDAELPGLNEALRVAMATYEALRELNLSYQPDPVTPYAVFRGKDNVVDLVNLPRQTLQRASGDCDDLTALYCALLECAGVETGFITVPGHVYPVFNTKLPLRSAGLVAAEPSLVIPVDGESWLPVEATLVESSAFDEAWRKGAEEWNALERTPSSRALHRTRSAQASYRAIGLKETDLGLQYGRADAMLAAYKSVQSRYAEALAKRQQALAAASGRKQDYNRLGIFLATLGRAEAAEGAFKKALSMDPAFVSAMVNLGNVALEGGSPKKALGYYLEAQAQIEKKGSASPALADLVLGRLAKTYGALSDATRVESYAKRREAFAASLPGGGSARASEAGRDDGRYLDGEE